MKLKKHVLYVITASSLLLAACGGNPQDEKPTTFVDTTAKSRYGSLLVNNPKEEYKPGDVVSFSVTSNSDFFVEGVTFNGKAIEPKSVEEAAEATNKNGNPNVTQKRITKANYEVTLAKGTNKVASFFVVDKEIDWVDKFKLNVPDYVYNVVSSDTGYQAYDFRVNGIEEMQTTYTDGNSAFINYVDGDTTHVSTRNYGYTVKIRYLGIDTPESTSELEEWGKSASMFNKETLSSAKHIILESQGWARGDEKKGATADGNQRSLAYVWYSTKEKPTKNDYRCLNLEMVYQGYSQGIGSIEDMGEDFFNAFDGASKSAQINKRHQYSGELDPNYFYYGKDNPPVEKTLKEVYQETSVSDAKPYTLSCNLFDIDKTKQNCSKTLYKISGYVTRKVSGAFYFQDKPSYTMPTDGSLPEAYGMYVFTYAQTPISVGDYVSVIGVLSSYGGTLQMMGISYHNFDADPYRDTIIDPTKSVKPSEIKPIKLTKDAYLKADGTNTHKNLQHVLVSFEDDVYTFADTGATPFADGGIQEVDRYNTHYPFYCTSNKLVFFGAIGGAPTADNFKKGNGAIRIVQDQNIYCTYGSEKSVSYKFFAGGTNYYNPRGAEYVYNYPGGESGVLTPDVAAKNLANATTPEAIAKAKEEVEIAKDLIKTEYKAKKVKLTGIWGNYISSSGSNYRDQVTIVSPADVNILGTY